MASLQVEERKTVLHFLFFVFLFVALFLFFFKVQPLVILDSDDWYTISLLRLPLPLPSYWNPSRIFPETLMPACGYLGAFIYHIFGTGYIESISFVFSIAAAFFIGLYTYEFLLLLEGKFDLSFPKALLSSLLFLSMHFILYIKGNEPSQYLFWSYDVTCFFYYTLSAVFNCTVVLFLMRDPVFKTKTAVFLLAIAVYFCLFSNLFSSIILGSYAGFRALQAWIRKEKKKCIAYSTIVLGWLLALFLESLGGRASGSVSFSASSISTAAKNLMQDFYLCGKLFYLELLALFIISLLVAVVRKRINISIFLICFFLCLIVSLFLVLLCSVVSTDYILRPQVFWGTIFFVLLFFFLSVADSDFNNRTYSVVLSAILVVNVIVIAGHLPFAESNTLGIPSTTCTRINNDLISQITSAIDSGSDSVCIEVMDTGFDDNWPHSKAIINGLKQSLLRHRVIKDPIEISIRWSTDFNDRYDLVFTKHSEYRFYG